MLSTIKTRRALAVAGAFAFVLGVSAPAALADYAPKASDVVGVGSDTVQYASDFIADSDHLGDTGYNALGNTNRLVNFDATPDANARLAYSAAGLGSATTALCAPGTGSTAGTGNASGTHAGSPCGLNPTLVLRAGLNPVQRPNGSGAGYDAMLRDTGKLRYVDYSRSSACQGAGTGCRGKVVAGYDSIQIGSDPLAILTATTTNAPSLSVAMLKSIYTCAATKWTDVGGGSSDPIIALLPQLGSGTRSFFLGQLGLTEGSLGTSCGITTVEENDPTAIAATTNAGIDTIEPMSGGRLNLFLGKLGTGGDNSSPALPYFQDSSCQLLITTGNCATASKSLKPAVTLVAPAAGATASDGAAVFNVSRPLYIYFRDADVNSTKMFQPGGTLNWVRTLLYNPCSAAAASAGTCSTDAVTGASYGPGGAPYYASTAGQTLIAAAGISPTYVTTLSGP